MTTASRQPANRNLSHDNYFSFAIEKIPNVTYFCQKVTLPGISVNVVETKTGFSTIKRQGDVVNYEDLSITFMIDEDFQAYLELYDWMVGIGFPQKFEQYRALKNQDSYLKPSTGGLFSDAILTILTSASNPKLEIHFRDVWPTSLPSIDFAHDGSGDPVVLTATATFAYNVFTVERRESNGGTT